MRSEIVLIMLFAIVLLVKNRARVIAFFTGTDQKTAPVKKAPIATPAKNKEDRKEPEEKPNWFLENLWSVLLALTTVAFLGSFFIPELRPADVGAWSQKYWLQILLSAGVLAFLALSIKEELPKTFQNLLAGTAVMLLVVLPFWSWISSSTPEKTPLKTIEILPQDAPNLPWAWNADGSITDTSKWPRVKVPPHGDSDHVPGLFDGHVVWGGSGFEIHYRYSDGHICIFGDARPSCGDGAVVEGWAHNKGDTLLYASYAYAHKGEK